MATKIAKICTKRHSEEALTEHAIVESQILMRGQAVTLARQSYGSSMQMIVVSPVLKLFSNATTDDHFQLIRVNSHVSLIEQCVHVTSQEQTILGFMRTARAVALMCAASSTGSVRSPVIAHLRS